jgi:beta-1,4-N-acetylglucosaminyltransferase
MANTWTWSEGSNMKVCFVTTGATAPFTGLIEAVLRPSSIIALQEAGYTHLLVQYGAAKDVFDRCAQDARECMKSKFHEEDLIIEGIDFSPEGLKEQFRLVQQSKGLAISHAGISFPKAFLLLICQR